MKGKSLNLSKTCENSPVKLSKKENLTKKEVSIRNINGDLLKKNKRRDANNNKDEENRENLIKPWKINEKLLKSKENENLKKI